MKHQCAGCSAILHNADRLCVLCQAERARMQRPDYRRARAAAITRHDGQPQAIDAWEPGQPVEVTHERA